MNDSTVSSQSISLLIDCALQLTNDNDKVSYAVSYIGYFQFFFWHFAVMLAIVLYNLLLMFLISG